MANQLSNIILITTKGCFACNVARNVLKGFVDDYNIIEYDVKEIPYYIKDVYTFTDFPVTFLTQNIDSNSFKYNHVFVGSFSKNKLKAALSSITN